MGITEMRGIVLILLVVPVIGWVLNSKPYILSIINYCSKFLNTTGKFYVGLMMITQMVSFFLLPASVPVTYQFVSHFKVKENKKIWEYMKSIAILRGYALTGVWSLSVPSFVFAVEVLGASVMITMMHGFFLSLVGVLLSSIFFLFYKREETKSLTIEIREIIQNQKTEGNNRRIFIEFVVLLLSLILLILTLNYLVSWSILRIIPIVIIFWTFGYFLVNKKLNHFVWEGRTFFGNIPFKSKEISIFLSAGLLVASLNISGIGQKLVEGSYNLVETVTFINFLMILPVFVMVFSFFGLPATASMVVICSIIGSLPIPYNPELLVISLATGTVGGILLSPFMIPGILLSNVNENNPYQNTFFENKLYVIGFLILAQIYLQIWWYLIIN